MLLLIKSAELLNLEISTRGLGYHKEVGVVQMWLDMYRDHGEYIWTWLETGEVREWTDVPFQGVFPGWWASVCPSESAYPNSV
jgi:hypothetical protein